jgi:hypothetical protein
MGQKKTNTFGTLWYMGLSVIAVPVLIVLMFIGMVVFSKDEAPLAKPNTDKKEKVVEKVYIHDTVEIPCRRKHCDEHIQKKPEVKQTDTTPTNKPDTLN